MGSSLPQVNLPCGRRFCKPKAAGSNPVAHPSTEAQNPATDRIEALESPKRFSTFDVSPGAQTGPFEGGTGEKRARAEALPADLERLAKVWTRLPEAVRRALVVMAEGAAGPGRADDRRPAEGD